jgi:hypothetical protein
VLGWILFGGEFDIFRAASGFGGGDSRLVLDEGGNG